MDGDVVKLTERTVQSARPGKYVDEKIPGLMLVVRSTGGRAWVLRYQINRKRRDMSLGSWPRVTLAQARQDAAAARRLLKDQKLDPLEVRGPRPPRRSPA